MADELRAAPAGSAPSPRPRIFYGWWILAASVVIELFGLGFGIFAITTVYPYIVDDFPEWSRSVVFLPTSVIILTVGVMGPITGGFIDRHPIRVLFAAGIVVQSAALWAFSFVQTPAQYVAASFFVGLGMSGVTVLPNQVLVSRWFHSRVGLVNGVVLAATAAGAAISPALITRIIEASDWRTAFTWMAVAAFLPPMIVVLAIVRDRPESLGLEPYGAAPGAADAPVASTGLAVAEVLRSRVFWAFAAVVFLAGLPCYSLNKHLLVFLKEVGFDAVSAADHKSFLFTVAACARVAFGWLSDHVDRRRIVVMDLLLIAIGYPLLLLVPSHREWLVPSLFLFGLGYGGMLPAIPILSLHYFGRRDLGKVLGAMKIVYDVSAAGAPLFTAWLYDRYGSYDVSQLWLTAFAWVAVVIAVALLPRRGFAAAVAPRPVAMAASAQPVD
jgi:MFS family permease